MIVKGYLGTGRVAPDIAENGGVAIGTVSGEAPLRLWPLPLLLLLVGEA